MDASFDAVLKNWDARFDPEAGLMRGQVGQVRYHTRLAPGTPVHGTRDSATYAFACLESPDPARHATAKAIWDKLLPLQDTDPESKSCGIWPWFFEEPLAQMSPPDWNWADFMGTQIAQILLRQPGRVNGSLRGRLENALRLAGRSIQKRDVRLSYTNIAIMGTYVTVMAGFLLKDPELADYGKKRLRRFVEFTHGFGGLPEYNSPDYMVINILELARMLRDFQDPGDVALAREIHDLCWHETAVHWHAPSRQWAGPHSRSYSTLLKPETLAFLQRGLGDRGTIAEIPSLIPSPDAYFLPVRCPDSCVPLFLDQTPRRTHNTPISEHKPPLQGRMHMEPGFVLSSSERSNFWNQSRGLIAYAPGEQGPVAAVLRFLHDGYDFCSANLLSIQRNSRVLAGICLAYDAGDLHGDLDKYPDRKLHASDWRLRFEFFNQDPLRLPGRWAMGSAQAFPFGSSAWMGISFLAGQFGQAEPFFETGSEDNRSWVDLVFYKGERKLFHFDGEFPAYAGVAVAVAGHADEARAMAQAEAEKNNSCLHLAWPSLPESNGHLKVPAFPLSEAEIRAWARAHVAS